MASNPALNALGHAVSGSVGTAISTAALYPLDLVNTRFKAQRKLQDGEDGSAQPHYDGLLDAFRAIIAREGGVPALYRGLGADVAKSVVDSFLFFGFYSYLRRRGNQKPKVLQELALGALAGACARAFTTPVSNVVTRKQVAPDEEGQTLREILGTIKEQNGFLGLWSGYSATLVLTLNPSITFFVNRRLASRVIPALEDEDVPVAWVAFLLAAFSKATATALTYPFQTGRTRLQMASKTPSEPLEEKPVKKTSSNGIKAAILRILELLDKTIFGVVLRIIRDDGFKALYDGLRGELLKSFFSHGLTMLTKGVIHRLVIRLWFLLAPHLAKRRLGGK
ncbi:Peroxisomal adenine nucleotide carrier 2 [Paramyrothecium foliicola]|nr:Peroxisomal adenine nucleotide carrier 2 [Paramyrothecium foliicola]